MATGGGGGEEGGGGGGEVRPSAEAEASAECVVCLDRPRDSILVHAGIGHHVCCTDCASRLLEERRPCPVCQRTLEAVLRYYC